MDDIFERVRNVLCECLDIYDEDRETIKLSSNLKIDLGVDSIDFVDIEIMLEKEFDIEIPNEALRYGFGEAFDIFPTESIPEDISDSLTVQHIVNYIASALKT